MFIWRNLYQLYQQINQLRPGLGSYVYLFFNKETDGKENLLLQGI